jgi:hypothetical protein
MLVYASSFDLIEKTETRIKRGALVSGISDISSKYIDVVRENEDIGEEVRHYDRYEGMYFKVADKKESVSSINVDAESLSLEDPVVALWTENPTYAEYLLSTFATAWNNSTPAEQRIQELLEEDRSHTEK